VETEPDDNAKCPMNCPALIACFSQWGIAPSPLQLSPFAPVAVNLWCGREGRCQVIRADPEILHGVAKIGNHAVPLAFVHKACSF
jgi:hypothetical protein